MHGLDPNTDLSFFNGKKLIQLALGCFEFQLHFHPNIMISVQSVFTLAKNGVDAKTFDCKPFHARELYVLLGKSVERWSIGGDGEILLYFEEDYRLTIFDSNARLESYVIRHAQDFFAV